MSPIAGEKWLVTIMNPIQELRQIVNLIVVSRREEIAGVGT